MFNDIILEERKKRKMITKEMIKIFIELFTSGKKAIEIEAALDLSPATIKRMKTRYFKGDYDKICDFKTAAEKKSNNIKSHSVLKEQLAIKLNQNPLYTLKNLSQSLEIDNILASPSLICKSLKSMDYTRKAVHRIPIDRNSASNKNVRIAYAREVSNITNENLLFLDESGFN